MRRLFCLLLTLLLLTAPALSEASGNLLGLSLLTDMTDGTKNAAVSPLSLQMALSLAREGAAGETRAELDALLAGDAIDTQALLGNARYADMYEGVTEEEVRAELDALLAGEAIDIEVLLAGIFEAPSVPGLRAANAGFVDPEVELLPDYVSRVDAEWFPLDADPANINAWASEHTDGLIDKILTAPLSPDTALCLVNALSMEARWEYAFDEDDTYRGAFHAPDGDVETDLMYQEHDFSYGERDGAQLVHLPYQGTSLAMYVVLPEEGGTQSALQALAQEGIKYFDGMEIGPDVHLTLPKFSLTYGGSLLDGLRARGMTLSASPDADFSAMCADVPLYIGDVLQNVRVDVDELGTRAAAVTAIPMLAGASMPLEEPEFVEMTVDRPFLFVIADEESSVIAFAGVVAEA